MDKTHRQYFCGPYEDELPTQSFRAPSARAAAQAFARRQHFRDGTTRVRQTVRVVDGKDKNVMSLWDVKLGFRVTFNAIPVGAE